MDCDEKAEGTDVAYRVMHAGRAIGWSPLSGRDSEKKLAYGDFTPSEAYEQVRPIFQIYVRAMRQHADDERLKLLRSYYQARDALNLALETEDGVVVPTAAIDIIDLRELTATEDMEIEAEVTDAAFFVRSG